MYAYVPEAGFCARIWQTLEGGSGTFYTGCPNQAGYYATEAECITTCIDPSYRTLPARCTKSIKSGHRGCLAKITRWGYDEAAGECVSFTYTGCGGNNNRFDTAQQCKDTCGL